MQINTGEQIAMDAETPTKPPIREQEWFKTCIAVLPFIRWTFMFALVLGGYYLYQRDVNAAQLVNVEKLQRDLEEVKKTTAQDRVVRDEALKQIRGEMLTRELYEAYHRGDAERMNRIEQSIAQLASRP